MDMKRVVGTLAVIIGAVAGKVAVRAAFQPDVKSEKFLSKVAAETNKGLPTMVDSETQLASTKAGPAMFIYEYRLVNMTADAVDASALESVMQPQIQTGACGNEDTRKILDAGVTMRYSYADKDGRAIADLDVSRSDCR